MVARWRPVHRGHAAVLRALCASGEETLIGIGSANRCNVRNPFTIEDEQRAVDYAMGLIARAWGHFGDFQDNMRARQSDDKVEALSKPIELLCLRCGGPVPVDAAGHFVCSYCGTTLKL